MSRHEELCGRLHDESVSQFLRAMVIDPHVRAEFRTNPDLRGALLRPARRYVVGQTATEAAERVDEFAAHGYGISLEYMGGEENTEPARIEHATRELVAAGALLGQRAVRGNICFDLSTIGLSVSADLARGNLESVLCAAAAMDNQVVVSIENSAKTDAILEVCGALAPRHSNLGITLQAYLKRTPDDLARIRELGGPIRLVKGAYREDAAIAYARGDELNDIYVDLLCRLGDAGHRVLAATHDATLLRRLTESYAPGAITFEMLRGVQPHRLRSLKEDGHAVSIYLAYGPEWLIHFGHRIAEFTPNLSLAVRDYFYPQAFDFPYFSPEQMADAPSSARCQCGARV